MASVFFGPPALSIAGVRDIPPGSIRVTDLAVEAAEPHLARTLVLESDMVLLHVYCLARRYTCEGICDEKGCEEGEGSGDCDDLVHFGLLSQD